MRQKWLKVVLPIGTVVLIIVACEAKNSLAPDPPNPVAAVATPAVNTAAPAPATAAKATVLKTNAADLNMSVTPINFANGQFEYGLSQLTVRFTNLLDDGTERLVSLVIYDTNGGLWGQGQQKYLTVPTPVVSRNLGPKWEERLSVDIVCGVRARVVATLGNPSPTGLYGPNNLLGEWFGTQPCTEAEPTPVPTPPPNPPPQCKADGVACSNPDDCCSGYCGEQSDVQSPHCFGDGCGKVCKQKPVDVCDNIPGNQPTVPAHMVASDGVCSCEAGYHMFLWVCVPDPPPCKAQNEYCLFDSQCCSNSCDTWHSWKCKGGD